MNAELVAALRNLPIRTRVAIALSSAQYALQVVSDKRDLYDPAMRTLLVAWEWEEGNNIGARQLYNEIYPLLLQIQENDSLPEYCLASLHAVVYALYYVTWHSRKLEILEKNPKYDRPLPSDIAEVTEGTISDCLDSVERAIVNPNEWVEWQSIIEERILDIPGAAFDELGRPIPRDFFAS